MSDFICSQRKNLVPYVPGEQPKINGEIIKLNTNENPFPPSQKAFAYATEAAKRMHLYSDPTGLTIRNKIAELYSIEPDQIMLGNGSDDVLYLSFLTFCDSLCHAAFANITYGFYKVFAKVCGIEYTEIPLKEDLSIDKNDYINLGKTIYIANPNAPTGLELPLSDIEFILQQNPKNVVVIDEAYIDFGGESAVCLINKYQNLIVVQTFSKSRSMAGGRLGMAIGCKDLIADLNRIRFSINPFNVNAMTMAAGIGILEDEDYTWENIQKIKDNREYLSQELRKMRFDVISSQANFILVTHPAIDAEYMLNKLKEQNIFIRHFNIPEIEQYNRITIGTREQTDILLKAIKGIMEESK